MSVSRLPRHRARLLAAALSGGLLLALPATQAVGQGVADAATARFDIPAQDLRQALLEFWRQSGQELLYSDTDVAGKTSSTISGELDRGAALTALLRGTGLEFDVTPSGGIMVGERAMLDARRASQPGAAAAGGSRFGGIEEVIVTGQKREERIRDVPIAISAFSMDDLDMLKIEGGSELLRSIPNVSFSKSNFSMYNFSIRGIGTKAISASSDPAVAVSFNGTPLIRNRLFEQEYLDVQRVEVLRGPQGTLYGRNATAGVVNMIPNLPGQDFDGYLKGEVGNYGSRRLSGMVNLPMGNRFAARLAAAATQRDGFDYNTFKGTQINDRDLWSARLSLRWDVTDWISASLIWEHFDENDQRSRTGKQLCTRDPGPATVGATSITEWIRPQMSQGCLPGSLYNDAAFAAPNGLSFPHVYAANTMELGNIQNPDGTTSAVMFMAGDPYAGIQQSRDLRKISTTYDPVFEARNDVVQLNLGIELDNGLSLVSQTAYTRDRYYSSQDYARYVAHANLQDSMDSRLRGTFNYRNINTTSPRGIYVDPQLGPTDRMVSVDISQSANQQWSQEFRVQSAWDGPLNFSIGANYLDFESQDDYYVFNNMFSWMAEYFYNAADVVFDHDNEVNYIDTAPCQPTGPNDASADCIYVDPNPLNRINGDGHNYFRSKNVVRTKSGGIFGELYYQLSDTLKLTTGLRYTDDRKFSTPYPSQLLLGLGPVMSDSTGGKTAMGYPASPDIKQRWQRMTGRLVLDWKPVLPFTDETLIYASYARGYKGGGTNPPRVDIDPNVVKFDPLPETFAPEYVDAFEIGMKNSLWDGRLSLAATAFFYDYDSYQVSQIVDRISLNENFDARSMGLELEMSLQPIQALRVDANIGYLRTRIGDGSQSIDVMDRTQGNEDWVLMRPWVQVPSNCIAPREAVELIAANPLAAMEGGAGRLALAALCAGSARLGNYDPAVPAGPLPFWALFGFTYDSTLPYDPTLSPLGTMGSSDPRSGAPNSGRGFYADLSGNELPNSPRWTVSLGAQYTFAMRSWNLTLRGDHYWQDESYARVYNTDFDRLRSWNNTNFSVTLDQPHNGLSVQLYVKNAFDKAPITDFFVNSDDTGLTANVFTLDPRLVGISVSKRF